MFWVLGIQPEKTKEKNTYLETFYKVEEHLQYTSLDGPKLAYGVSRTACWSRRMEGLDRATSAVRRCSISSSYETPKARAEHLGASRLVVRGRAVSR